jgi:hypothetical protein
MGVATLRHEEQGVASNDFHKGGWSSVLCSLCCEICGGLGSWLKSAPRGFHCYSLLLLLLLLTTTHYY